MPIQEQYSHGEPQPTVGIGRPVNVEWLEEATTCITDVIGEFEALKLGLDIRDIVGVSYVTAEELAGLENNLCNPREEQKIERVKLLVASLLEDPAVDSDLLSITTSLSLSISGLELMTKSHNRSQRVNVKLLDKKSEGHSSGSVVEAEKVALRTELGLATIQRADPTKLPTHLLKLGIIKGLPPSENKEVRRRIKFPSLVPLEPVGPTKL